LISTPDILTGFTNAISLPANNNLDNNDDEPESETRNEDIVPDKDRPAYHIYPSLSWIAIWYYQFPPHIDLFLEK